MSAPDTRITPPLTPADAAAELRAIADEHGDEDLVKWLAACLGKIDPAWTTQAQLMHVRHAALMLPTLSWAPHFRPALYSRLMALRDCILQRLDDIARGAS